MSRIATVLLTALCLAAPAVAQPVATPSGPAGGGKAETVDEAICRLIEASARRHGLPVGFFTRLIWRESSFRLDVVSRAGAQGVAQFMPGTARERGLADPFDPEAAIPASAAFLAELKARFGNLGLAAAGYNAGPDRVRRYLAGEAGLPAETVSYVARVTGRSAEEWAADARLGRTDAAAPDANPDADPDAAAGPDRPGGCLVTLAAFRRPGGDAYVPSDGVAAVFAPWGVQVAGNFSRARALAGFDRLRSRHADLLGETRPMIIGTRFRARGTRPFYRVRLPAETRRAAEDLCERLRRVGGACIVLKS